VDVFRLNFSHGSHEEHGDVIRRIRSIENDRGRPLPILQDLAGPKIRIGTFEDGKVELKTGQPFTLTVENVPGTTERVSVTYPELPQEVSEGDSILLSDGALELRVTRTGDTEIRTEVLVGGELSSHKGINLPSGTLKLPVLTEKDCADLSFGLEQGIDLVAASFVRTAKDIEDVRDAMGDSETAVPVIGKIEKHEALENIDRIIEAVDGMMIARGDLGVETPVECIPRFQKQLTSCGNRAAKPVITATHMLRSMVDSPRPTRAEVTDIANAVLDGSDAIMLSEETAVGRYPCEAVRMMDRTIRSIEEIFPFASWSRRYKNDRKVIESEAVAHASCSLAEETEAAAIVTCTLSGSTTRRVAKYRPSIPVVSLTPDEAVWRQLCLVWGVRPYRVENFDTADEMEEEAVAQVLASGLAKAGQKVVITAGLPLQVTGGTNLVKVVTLPDV